MLSDNYKTFESIADCHILDWRTVSKNSLFHKYIEYERSNPTLSSAYFAAIMCRYWNNISSLYYNSQPVFTEQDCYDWLVNSVLYTLKNRKWLDPKCSLYKDPNGPDKALNICIKSERLTAYQVSNRYKRKGNALTVSIEQQSEEYGDYYTPDNLMSPEEIQSNEYDYLVLEAFKVKDYFKAFMLDIIMYEDVFLRTLENDTIFTEFSRKKLIHFFRMIEDDYMEYFSERYNINIDKVRKAFTYCTNLSTDTYISKVERVRRDLQKYFKGKLA